MDSESPLDLSTKRYLFPHINPRGRVFVGIAFVFACVVLGLTGWLAPIACYILIVPMCLLVYWVGMFFRDPERVLPKDEKAIVSPADGVVSCLKKMPLPEELGTSGGEVWRVSVFMSVLDVHVNRMPASGKIKKICYVPGKYLNASLDKASKDNERKIYLVTLPDGRDFCFVQIAGLIARRIVSFVKEGDELPRGERFGLIRFGSRLDIYLPAGVEPEVVLGQTMVAGESVLGRL